MTAPHHISLLLSAALFLLPAFSQDAAPSFPRAIPWLSDEQARGVAAAAIHSVYPQPCYSTYRNENLESFLLDVRNDPIVDNQLNNSVYFYRVASDACSYVVEKDGKHALMTQISSDCCEYGIVAVDRVTAKSYWFGGKEKATEIFKKFVQDEQLRPDAPRPALFVGLYLGLVRDESGGREITSVSQLRDLVQSDFQSAYSPYERDDTWQRKFDYWWRQFQRQVPRLKLETTYEAVGGDTIVSGYGFRGFVLTTPRGDPPPKGAATLVQWSLLVKRDGKIEERPSKVIYSSR